MVSRSSSGLKVLHLGVPVEEGPAAYQLVGRVTAYQGDDG